jgi:hypothetical protein
MDNPMPTFLKRHLPRQWTYTANDEFERNDEYLEHLPPEGVSPLVDKIARFLVAFTAGSALFVPMLIMRLHSSVNKSLITTLIAVVLFARALSVGLLVSDETTTVATRVRRCSRGIRMIKWTIDSSILLSNLLLLKKLYGRVGGYHSVVLDTCPWMVRFQMVEDVYPLVPTPKTFLLLLTAIYVPSRKDKGHGILMIILIILSI